MNQRKQLTDIQEQANKLKNVINRLNSSIIERMKRIDYNIDQLEISHKKFNDTMDNFRHAFVKLNK